MRHYHLNFNEDHQETDLNVSIKELKLMHNLCVDLVRTYPEMIDYRLLQRKLCLKLQEEIGLTQEVLDCNGELF
jgi:hypothetical protein